MVLFVPDMLLDVDLKYDKYSYTFSHFFFNDGKLIFFN